MKSSNEMVNSLLERRDNYIKERKKRNKIIAAVFSVLCCAAVICSVKIISNSTDKKERPGSDGFNVVSSDNSLDVEQNYKKKENDSAVSENFVTEKEKTSKADNSEKMNTSEEKTVDNSKNEKKTDVHSSDKKQVVSGDVTSTGGSLILWKNKIKIGGALCGEIENNPNGIFKVSAVYRPPTANITSFVYKGKTLGEWAVEADNEKRIPEKMKELLKFGDSLKYGTDLYLTGTPSGEKWDRRLYEDKVNYFGEELLGKYIVNGVFLKEKLEKDIAFYDTSTSQRNYEQAYNAYMETVLSTALKKLSSSNIKCEISSGKVKSLIITVSAEQLANLPLDDLNNWYFDTADNVR